jgi:hypothetical protein
MWLIHYKKNHSKPLVRSRALVQGPFRSHTKHAPPLEPCFVFRKPPHAELRTLRKTVVSPYGRFSFFVRPHAKRPKPQGAPGTFFLASRDFLQGLSRDNFHRGTRDFQGQKNIEYIYIMRDLFLKLN